MTRASEIARKRWASERMTRFQRKPEVMRIANKYGDDPRYLGSTLWKITLAGIALLFAAGVCSRQEYRATIRSAAKVSGIPLCDMKIIALCFLELSRCALIGSGQSRILVND